MFKKMTLLFTLVLLVLSFGLPVAAQDNVLVMSRAADTTGLDPHTQTAFASFRLLELIYEPLVNLAPDLSVIPALAESWAFNDDATQLTLNLRQGVTFHDGSAFTAEDVVATFTRILDEATGAAARANYLSIASIDTPDDYTVVLNLSQADVPLLAALATTNAAIANKEDIESGAIATVANGTGPFKLDSWTPEETTQLSANADWWGEGPNVDGIEIRITPDETSILAALRAADDELARLADASAGAVRLAAFPSASSTVIPSLIAALAESHPLLQLSFTEAEPPEALAMLADGSLDIAVTFRYPGDPADPHDDLIGTTSVALFDDPVQIVLPADHPIAGRPDVSLAELGDVRWIAGCPLCRGHLLAACSSVGITPRIAHATDNSVAVLGLVAAGVGVALQPQLALEPLELPARTTVHRLRPASDRKVQAIHVRGAEAVPGIAAVLGTLLGVTAGRRQPRGASQRSSASRQV